MRNRKKHLAFVLALALCASVLPLPASAASSCDGVVIASSLNMRSGAGAEYALLGNAPRGTTITVIGISTEDAGWFKVSYNGQEGYMNSEYIINADSSQAAAAIADAAAAAAAARAAAAAAAANPPAPVVQEAPAPAVEVQEAPATVEEPSAPVAVEEPSAPAEETPALEAAPVPAEPEPEEVIFSPTGASNAVVTGDLVRFRATPGGEILGNFRSGTRIYVSSSSGAWYEVNCDGTVGYIHSSYAVLDAAAQPEPEPESAPTAAPAPTPEPTPAPTPVYVAANSVGGQRIVDTAMQFQGVPYVWGGTSPSGFDCSGLVYYTYQLCGYSINRVAQSIYTGTGTAVTRDQLAVGDIICFGNSSYVWHVGIYIGNNQFIHAPNSGAVVRVESLSGTYANNFVCGKRVV